MTPPKPVFPRLWIAVYLVFLVFFAFTRFSNLDARPLHHDEGVNGVFLKGLLSQNDWKYDPQNYHGPSLYYLQVIPSWINGWRNDGKLDLHSISGLSPTSIRAVVAFAGMLILLGLLAMGPGVGRWAAFIAFVLAGFSCDLIFFSRYFIHETYVALFTFGIVLGVERYAATQKKLYMSGAILSAALLFCTKETSLVHFAILALAWVATETTEWLLSGRRETPPFERMAREPGRIATEMGQQGIVALAIALVVWMLMFSSFFANPRGLIDSIRTYFFWGGEGFHSGHVKPFFYYLSDILLPHEIVLVILSLLGLFVAFARNDRIGLFLAYWTLGMVGCYSFIPYKTPWLVENFIVPMSLLSGYGVQALTHRAVDQLKGLRAAAALTAFLGCVLLIGISQIPLTFRTVYKEYDSDRHPQVYAHTLRSIFDLLSRIDAASVKSGRGRKMAINIFSDEYWPLPFYLAKYDSALFWGKVDGPGELDAPVLIARPQQREELESRLKETYAVTSHDLRPGVPLLLYINTQIVPGQEPLAMPINLPRSIKDPGPLSGGLRLEVFRGANFSGPPVRTVAGDAGWDFSWRDDSQKIFQSPFSLKWTGFLKVDQAGAYKFSLDSDDGSWLLIDGETVINNGGDHSPVKLSRQALLSAGYHRIEVRYYDALGGAVLRFAWAGPNGAETVVPGAAVFHAAIHP